MLKKTLTKKVYDCKANDLLNVVADVKSYSEFVPFCSDINIYDRYVSQELEHFTARLFISFKLISETFITNVTVNRKLMTIKITGSTKPFNSLIADWSFVEQDNLCKVTFSLEASFKSFMKEKLVSISFEKMALKVIEAFEKRVKKKNF